MAIQRTAFTFARMPIVIVAYSGGFGPTLSVLDRGGVRSRVRGLVLLDALYGGTGKFADWITDNRSTFFVSSYTPHTAHRNVDLEHLLRKRSVPYSSELRDSHLQGMVTFLPAGDVSHRDFVTHAWADNPIKDILLRMDDSDLRIETAERRRIEFPRHIRIEAQLSVSSAFANSSVPDSVAGGCIGRCPKKLERDADRTTTHPVGGHRFTSSRRRTAPPGHPAYGIRFQRRSRRGTPAPVPRASWRNWQ